MQGIQNNYIQNQGNRNINYQQQLIQNEKYLNIVGKNINRRGWMVFNNEGKIFAFTSFELFQILNQYLERNHNIPFLIVILKLNLNLMEYKYILFYHKLSQCYFNLKNKCYIQIT